MSNVLITGACGQLGKSVVTNFPAGYKLTTVDLLSESEQNNYYQLDITDPVAVEELVQKVKPDIIVHLAAMTNVDGCERNPELSYAANVASVSILSRAAPEAHLIHISSDYVFDGKSGPYDESDQVNPINVYGQHKLESEFICLDHPGRSTVIRTNVVFDYIPTTQASFVKWVIDQLAEHNQIRIVNDQWNNPTWTDSLARTIYYFILNQTDGLYHFGGEDWLNRYDFALMIARVFNLDPDLIIPISTTELKQDAPRPLKSGLKTDLIRMKFGLTIDSLEECLTKIRQRLQKAGII